jgi:RsiW-degrading membrane proteinase PrsW (M82 family)
MNINIIRNGQEFGPYDSIAIKQYLNEGKILLHDKAKDIDSNEVNIVSYFCKKEHIRVHVKNKGGIVEQLRSLGSNLIFPYEILKKREWLSDKKLLVLALVGLGPSCIMFLPIGGLMVFYSVALYFSAIWGMFFYYLFKTDQVKLKTTLLVFFATQAFVFLLWDILGMPALNPFYSLTDSNMFIFSLFGFVLGVGLTEECVKLIPLILIYKFAHEPLQPKTLVFYGLMSGIAFGVFEGVQYQVSVNALLDYTSSFFLNISRLTSLPFLHAIWTGIAGYFIGFAKLYPLFRRSLYFLAIVIPCLLHGFYDAFCPLSMGVLITFAINLVAVILLNTYLKQSLNYQSKIIKC